MRKLFLLLCLVSLALTTSAQTSKLFRYLPQEANMIMSFNPVKIANYIPGDMFRQSSIYRQMMKEDNGELKAFLSDPSISGIDFSADLLLTVITDTAETSFGSNNTIITVIGLLKNEALFSVAAKKIAKGDDLEIKTYGTDKVLIQNKVGPAIAWNNEIFVLTTGNQAAVKNALRNQFDLRDEEVVADTAVAVNDAVMAAIDTVPAITETSFDMDQLYENFNKELRNYCFELLTPKNNNRLINNSHFIAVQQEKGDVKIWSNSNEWANSSRKLPPQVKMIFSKLKLFPNTERTATISFENGKISSVGNNYLTPEQNAIYSKYTHPSINTNLTTRLPTFAQPLLMVTGAAEPQLLKELLTKAGIISMLEEEKEKIPFNTSLLASAFGASSLFAVVNVPVKENATEKEPRSKKDEIFKGLHIVLAMPIKNKRSFEELRDTVQSMLTSLKSKENNTEDETNDDGTTNTVKKLNFFKDIKTAYKYNDSLFVFSTSDELATAYINGTNKTDVPSFIKTQQDFPLAMQFSIRGFINSMYKNAGSPSKPNDIEMLNLLNMFGDMYAYNGKYENGTLKSKFEMQIGKSDENALKQLFELINKAAEAKAKEKEEWMKESNNGDLKSERISIEEVKVEEKKSTVEPPPPPPKINRTPVKRVKK